MSVRARARQVKEGKIARRGSRRWRAEEEQDAQKGKSKMGDAGHGSRESRESRDRWEEVKRAASLHERRIEISPYRCYAHLYPPPRPLSLTHTQTQTSLPSRGRDILR